MKLKPYILLILVMTFINCKEDKPLTLYVGTYTDTDSEGIYKMQFNTNSGRITNVEVAAKIASPSYLAISPNKEKLYAVQESNDFENGAGAVTAFTIENDSLIEIQTVSSGGAHPCHLSLSPAGDKLGVANYSGGNANVYDIAADGKLSEPGIVMNHTTIDSAKTAHAHMIQWLNDDIYVADLGLDALLEYRDQPSNNAKAKATIQLPKGVGPRHFTSTQNGRFLYVINELNSTIAVFEKNAVGGYVFVHKVSTLADNFEGESFCADIHVSADGKFVYGSNRGENTIVIFNRDQHTGQLTLVGRESVHGEWPRNFTIDPTGKFLLVANQNSNNISVFKRDQELGTLSFKSEQKLAKPVCLLFL